VKNITNKVATFLVPCIFIVFISIIFSPNLFKANNQKDIIYAETISIYNLPREINMNINNSLVFEDLPYKITPSNCNAPVSVKILSNLGVAKEGATYKDKVFRATKTGLYYLRFCVDNAFGTTLHDTIKVNVVYELDSSTKTIKINYRAKDIYLDESIDLLSMVTIYNFNKEDITFSLDDIIFTDSIFSPTKIGNYTIKINADAGNYCLVDEIVIRVKERPESLIKLYDSNYNLIDFTKPYIANLSSNQLIFIYELQGITKQVIECFTDNSNVSILSYDSPLIIIDLINVGETNFTIYANDRTEILTLTLLIEE